MGQDSKIQWTDHTFSPWRGCTKVAAGCINCYADAQSKRNPGVLGVWGPNGSRVVAAESTWQEPLKWDRQAEERFARYEDFLAVGAPGTWTGQKPIRPKVFCASISDVFEDWQGLMMNHRGDVLRRCPLCQSIGINDEINGLYEIGDNAHGCQFCRETFQTNDGEVPAATMDDVRRRLFGVIDATTNLDWLILTKRPENIKRMWVGKTLDATFETRESKMVARHRENAWLGTSIANQDDAVRNVPELLKCRDMAKVLFLSIEPMVGPVDLTNIPFWNGAQHRMDCLRGYGGWDRPRWECKIDWVIVGGESGSNARSCNVAWIRSIVEQCKQASVPCFVKQLGARAYDPPINDSEWAKEIWRMRELKDKKGGNPEEWPDDLRVREFPQVVIES